VKPDRRVVLDASAASAWVLKERGADVVDTLLPYAVIPSSALTETLYRAVERGHGMLPDELASSLSVMGIDVEPVTGPDAVRAAELIAESRTGGSQGGSLSLGDGLCLAVAERIGLPITGGDDYWTTLDLRTEYFPFR
jgi:PIN domain nuclease of toxin-antitoxin system